MSKNSSFVAIPENYVSEKVRDGGLEESDGHMQSGHKCSGVVSVSVDIGVGGGRHTTEASVLCCAAGNASSGKIQQSNYKYSLSDINNLKEEACDCGYDSDGDMDPF